jgi:3-hydroxyisobutyrate dehydrogenase-like beta-hydroxyacid dehydrogenase
VASVGFIGLGAMGSRMARRLLGAGLDVTVWNRTPARAERLAAAGAADASTPADAARAGDIVITMLADPAALRAVTDGSDGVLAGLRPGSAFVEMSTVGPGAVAELAAQLPEGVQLLDAPVLGSLAEAEEGGLRIFVGGDEEALRLAMPVLEALGRPLHVGPLGSGAAAKLVANSTLFGVLAVLGEALALGDGLGLAREAVFEVLSGTPVAAQAERRRASIEAADYPPRFRLSLARKDADLVAAAAGEAGVELRVAAAARSWLVEAERAGWGALDYSAALARMLGDPRLSEGREP